MYTTGTRILAQGQTISNDTWTTQINNNDLILGPSGAGKTRSYVKPNLLQCSGSVVVADTKGCLIQEIGPALARQGYRVLCLDFDSLKGACGYNPLDFIHRDPKTGRYSDLDVMTVAAALIPIENDRDPFWEQSARMHMASIIGYILECLPPEEHTLEYVAKLYGEMGGKNYDRLFEELGEENPASPAYLRYRLANSARADKTYACVQMFLAEKLSTLTSDGLLEFYRRRQRVNFRLLGREKTALFLTISDVDRSRDRLVNLFYTQALQELIDSADRDFSNHRLPVPVRFILDDFATNVYIPNFDKIISVIRSREISVSVILQSISQLNALYGEAKAKTIINNCDNCLYLGGQDVETARYISVKANRTADTILNMGLDEAYLFTRGQPPKKVRKFDLRSHALYQELPEAAAQAARTARGGQTDKEDFVWN